MRDIQTIQGPRVERIDIIKFDDRSNEILLGIKTDQFSHVILTNAITRQVLVEFIKEAVETLL